MCTASLKSFEWTLIEGEDHVIHTGELPAKVKTPDYAHLLPEEIRHFTRGGVYNSAENPHASFIQGSGHGGSHPHLVNEFLHSIWENRKPYPNAVAAANMVCVGILAHASAMHGGEIRHLPEFTFG